MLFVGRDQSQHFGWPILLNSASPHGLLLLLEAGI
jgi:hypothetical protein